MTNTTSAISEAVRYVAKVRVIGHTTERSLTAYGNNIPATLRNALRSQVICLVATGTLKFGISLFMAFPHLWTRPR